MPPNKTQRGGKRVVRCKVGVSAPLSGGRPCLPPRQWWQEGSRVYPPCRGHFWTRARLPERVRGGQEVAPRGGQGESGEMGKLEVDLAVDGHEARRSHMAVYCKIPLQRPFRSLAWPPRGWIPCPSHILSSSRPRVQKWPRKGVYMFGPSCHHCLGGKQGLPPERGALTPTLHWTTPRPLPSPKILGSSNGQRVPQTYGVMSQAQSRSLESRMRP